MGGSLLSRALPVDRLSLCAIYSVPSADRRSNRTNYEDLGGLGPFPIVQEVSSVAFRIRLPKTLRVHDVFHVSMLKPYKEGGIVQPPPRPEIIEGEEEYEVEAVLAHRERKLRGRKTAREYLVKWTGYEDIHNTWEPEDNLEHAREALQRYWDLTTEHGPEQNEKVDKKRKGRGKNAQKQRKRARRA
eukprot:jgi/Botrbrau1/16000/Bobra.200_2s0005.1